MTKRDQGPSARCFHPSDIAGDRYETPEGIPRALSEYVLLGTRWSVYCHFFATVLRYRPFALRGQYDGAMWSKSSHEVIANLERCGARFEISGLDRLRAAQGPLVIVANHMSTLETMVLPGLIQPLKPVTFIVKEKLMKGLIWGPVQRARDSIPVTRKDPRADLETVLTEGGKRLAAGTSVVVFPQGTRTETWRRAGFNSLGVKLASRAGVRVLPVALKTDYWGSSGIFRGFGPIHRTRRVHIEFGEPIEVAGRGKAAHEACLDFIESRLRLWGASIEASAPAASAEA